MAQGHMPSEAYVFLRPWVTITKLTLYRKIENFIRTKYESKRWVMDGGIPDPSTLDVSDDDVVSHIFSRKFRR